MKRSILFHGCGAVIALAFLLVTNAQAAPPAKSSAITITSPAFAAEGMIPAKYTCQGADVSPPLAWTGLPAGTKTLALICDDPDAPSGTWVHWVLYDLPAAESSLPEKIAPQAALPNGAKQGVNGFGKLGYGGPSPPAGRPHHYFFKLYALDSAVALKPGGTKDALLQAMAGHILGEGILMAKYQRRN